MVNTTLFKIIIVTSLIVLGGCKKLPNFPNVFYFYSHADLLKEAKEIKTSLSID
tara:strand:+ start:1722 stop:1883 length:162 start_codon:yes stop_codon:yes gene_type:complete